MLRLVCAVLIFAATHVLAGTNAWSIPGGAAPQSSPWPIFVVDPVNPSIMYRSADNTASLLKSTDGGVTWIATSLASTGLINLIAIAPSNPSIIYVNRFDQTGPGEALFRSTDGGATWQLLNIGLPNVSSLAIDPNDPDTVYAGHSNGVLKSTNGGNTWSSVLSLSNVNMYRLFAISPSHLYGLSSRFVSHLFETSDAGATWRQVAGYPGGPFAPFAIDPSTPSTMYSEVGVTIIRSVDGGSTWSPMDSLGLPPASEGPIELQVMPGSGTLLVHQVTCGFFVSFDQGKTFVDTNQGLPTVPRTACPASNVPSSAIALSPAAPSTVFVATVSGPPAEFTSDPSALPPTCFLSASPSQVFAGGASTLSAYCSPPATSYVWSSNTGFDASASSGSVTPSQTAAYTVQGVNGNGPGNVASASVVVAVPRLANLSTRARVGATREDFVIAGFIVGGSLPKTLVVRATGPSLAAHGVASPLLDPALEIYENNQLVQANNDWGNQPASDVGALQASGLAPNHFREAAIIRSFAPGKAYGAIVFGLGGATGIANVEVFEVDRPDVPLINISTRAQVLSGDNVMIAGFIIQGDSPKTVVINAAAPSLTNYLPASSLLADPKLTLVRSSDQAILATNDDWGSSADAAAIQASGFAPNHSKEPAIIATLPPGAYTAIVEGVNGGTGKAVVGVFAVP
jgi:photosystem II stability/assembly factor-like uncharacterized protein